MSYEEHFPGYALGCEWPKVSPAMRVHPQAFTVFLGPASGYLSILHLPGGQTGGEITAACLAGADPVTQIAILYGILESC